jgi:hypothetical protein
MLDHLIESVELSAQLRSDFKAVADTLGPKRAFYAFAGEVVQAGLDKETEEKFVRIVRATYDDYLKRSAVRACRVCGCTDAQACPGGCSWAGADLCSACVSAPQGEPIR